MSSSLTAGVDLVGRRHVTLAVWQRCEPVTASGDVVELREARSPRTRSGKGSTKTASARIAGLVPRVWSAYIRATLPSAISIRPMQSRRSCLHQSISQALKRLPFAPHASRHQNSTNTPQTPITVIHHTSSASTRHNTSSKNPSNIPSTPSPIPTGATPSQWSISLNSRTTLPMHFRI